MPKYTVELNERLNEILEDLSTEQNTPKTQVIRRAISVLKYLDDEHRKGNKVLIADPTGKAQREIVIA
jgi:hypothetical protein